MSIHKYQPSNGMEGEAFIDSWCGNCIHDRAFREDPDNNDSCRIVARSLAHNVSDPEYPPEWRYNENGTPVCTAFEPDPDAQKRTA